jgi:hypothetical protein
VVLVITLTAVAYTVLLERKVVGRIQNRWGPSRVGPFGLLQPLADGIKLFLKEDMIPSRLRRSSARAHHRARLRADLDRRRSLRRASSLPRRRYLQIADLNIGLLVILGITSIGVYGIALSGWSSNNKYSLLGSLRATAQMISYELALGLSLVGVVLRAGSLNCATSSTASPPRHRSPGTSSAASSSSPSSSTSWPPTPRPTALPSISRSRIRAHRRLSHRVQLHEVRHVLHGRVRQHDHRRLRRHAALLRRRWSSPFGHLFPQPAEHLLHAIFADSLVRRQGLLLPLSLHLGARHAAALPLRPAHGLRLEVPLPVAMLNIVGTSLWLRVTSGSTFQAYGPSCFTISRYPKIFQGIVSFQVSDSRDSTRPTHHATGTLHHLRGLAVAEHSTCCCSAIPSTAPSRWSWS